MTLTSITLNADFQLIAEKRMADNSHTLPPGSIKI